MAGGFRCSSDGPEFENRSLTVFTASTINITAQSRYVNITHFCLAFLNILSIASAQKTAQVTEAIMNPEKNNT